MIRRGTSGKYQWVWGLILSVLFTMVQAQEPTPKIAANAPQSYIVKGGDTLWDIAGRFLASPWEWPQIWHSNPDIQNPNLIYPGDVIHLTYVNGQPRLSKSTSNQYETIDKATGIVKLRPRVRSTKAQSPIPAIPLHVISPFLNQSRVVTTQQASHCPKIVALDEDHLVVGEGDIIYVEGLKGLPKEQNFAIFRPEKIYQDPRNHSFLGIEGLVVGKAQVEKAGSTTRLVITDSFAEIKVGDRLIGTIKEDLSPFFVPKMPKGNAKGQIISVFGGVTQIGQFQVLVVTGGKDKTRQVGDVLGIFQTNKDIPRRLVNSVDKHFTYPPLKIGNCVVFRVFDKVSYVLVMNAVRPIYLLDEVTSP